MCATSFVVLAGVTDWIVFAEGDPALGCPVEYIDLKGTSIDKPAVCKYTGNKYYSDDWMHAH